MTDIAAASQPWYRTLDRAQWKTLVAANLGWVFDGYETYALIISVGVALRQLLDPASYAQIPVYAGTVIALTLLGWAIGGMIGGIQNSAQTAVVSMREAVGQVDRGTGLAEEAGTAITSIRSATGEVATVMNEISAAIAEQGVASTSIAQQVERVAQAAEENSATARESSAAAEALRNLAAAMSSQMARFRV